MDETDFSACVHAAREIATLRLDGEDTPSIDEETRTSARTFLRWVFDNYGMGDDFSEPEEPEDDGTQATD